eukprot:751054-Hanusia_phi.AAC.1
MTILQVIQPNPQAKENANDEKDRAQGYWVLVLSSLIELQASSEEFNPEAEIQKLANFIADVQGGMKSLSTAIGINGADEQNKQQDAVKLGEEALKSVQNLINNEEMSDQFAKARDSVLKNIGIGEDLVEEVKGPKFDLKKAVWLAGAAFDSYNDPVGGVVKKYEDGVKVSYTSSRMLSETHSGVLMLKLKSADLKSEVESAKCDAYLRVKVNGAIAKSKIVKDSLQPQWDQLMVSRHSVSPPPARLSCIYPPPPITNHLPTSPFASVFCSAPCLTSPAPQVMYTGPISTDELQVQLFDADLLMGNEDLDYLTPDPLIGSALIPLKEIASSKEWQTLTLDLVPPATPTTAADEDNRFNPYWARLPREVNVQSWPSIIRGGAVGGKVVIEAQFFPLNTGEDVSSLNGRRIAEEEEVSLLCRCNSDVVIPREIFEQENLERLCFIDNEETDTQVTLWRDANGKRIVLAFRGTEQTRWKDFLTDALITQQRFDPGADPEDDIQLPPLLASATASVAKKAEGTMEEGRGELIAVGSLGILSQSLSSLESISKRIQQLTGSDDYKFGDMSRRALQEVTGKDFKDMSELAEATLNIAQRALQDFTGKKEYEFGDITKTLWKKAESYKFGDITRGIMGGINSAPSTEPSPAPADSLPAEEESAVHVGFLRGYASVRRRILQIMQVLVEAEGGEGWKIFVTGHSLGGALSTLCAADVAAFLPRHAVVMYNFGSPRVGNLKFVQLFNQLVPEAFRVVNDADVVARVPRSRLMNYHHVGRTALVSSSSSVWVEGESEGTDPLRERWTELAKLVDAEISLLQGIVNGNSLEDHMEDAYFLSLTRALEEAEGEERIQKV